MRRQLAQHVQVNANFHFTVYQLASCSMPHRNNGIRALGIYSKRNDRFSSLDFEPNIAAKAGLKQGNLTYYFATRADLLAAVARTAIHLQLGAAKMLLRSAKSLNEATTAMGAVIARHENTRVFIALNQAADQDPALQALFTELLEGFVEAITDFLKRMSLRPTQSHVDLLHAVFVGLSVIDLATGRKNGNARAVAVLKNLFKLLSNHEASTRER
jgi:AcrR family transcriptional regulator